MKVGRIDTNLSKVWRIYRCHRRSWPRSGSEQQRSPCPHWALQDWASRSWAPHRRPRRRLRPTHRRCWISLRLIRSCWVRKSSPTPASPLSISSIRRMRAAKESWKPAVAAGAVVVADAVVVAGAAVAVAAVVAAAVAYPGAPAACAETARLSVRIDRLLNVMAGYDMVDPANSCRLRLIGRMAVQPAPGG
jgi:hypothetical protein